MKFLHAKKQQQLNFTLLCYYFNIRIFFLLERIDMNISIHIFMNKI
jgi:hypothetical protein